MIRFFHIRSRSWGALLGATSAVILSVSGPTATAQPVIPTLPESCVQLDENGVCVLPTGQPGDSELPIPPAQTPTPVLPDVPAAAEPDSVSSVTFELPTSDPVLDPASLPLSENEGEDAGDTPDGELTPEADVPDTGRENGAEGEHGGPGGGHGGHDDDEGDGGHHGGGGDHHDDDDGHGGHGGGKPSGDYTEHNTHTETNTNVEVVVNIPVTIINDNSTYVDNSVTDNSAHVDNSVTDNSVTVVEKNTTITEVSDVQIQQTNVQIGQYVYAERLLYLPEYDAYVLGCEYDGQVEVTAWYPQGVAKQDLPRHTPTRRLPQYQEAATGADVAVAAPAPAASELVTASDTQSVWLPLGAATILVVAAGMLEFLRRQRRRG